MVVGTSVKTVKSNAFLPAISGRSCKNFNGYGVTAVRSSGRRGNAKPLVLEHLDSHFALRFPVDQPSAPSQDNNLRMLFLKS